jgi:hypothetical protein
MGLADAYPFVWSAPAIDKLRYVHETVRGVRGTHVPLSGAQRRP